MSPEIPKAVRDTSLIVPIYNGLAFTTKLLDSYQEFHPRCKELILVNDGSFDGTQEFLNGLNLANVQILTNEQNMGYSASSNLGADLATGKYLCFLNNDLILTEDWLQPMLTGLLTQPNAGIVGNVQLNPSTKQVDHAGMFFDLDGCPRHAGHKLGKIRNTGYSEFQAVTAACFVIQKEVFQSVEGFDPVFRNGFEDVDLCMRLGREGFRHYVANESRIYHHVSQSPGRKMYEDRNAKIFLERWGDQTRELGRQEWPREYLKICRQRPGKFRPGKFALALWLMLRYRGSFG